MAEETKSQPAKKTTAKRKASGGAKAAPVAAAPAAKKPAAGKGKGAAAGAAPASDGASGIAGLVLDLASSNAGTVARAIARLRNNVTADQIGELAELLGRLDDTTELQAAAAEVAAGIEIPPPGDARRRVIVPLLHQKIERSTPVVMTASLVVLGRLAEDASTYPIIRVLQDKYRRTSVHAWDVEKHLRIAAARALGQIGNKDASVYLIEALNDPTGDVVIAVCDALQKIADARCLPNLQEVLRKAVREELKQKLIETINLLRVRRR
jgi:HEAT repeat protein